MLKARQKPFYLHKYASSAKDFDPNKPPKLPTIYWRRFAEQTTKVFSRGNDKTINLVKKLAHLPYLTYFKSHETMLGFSWSTVVLSALVIWVVYFTCG